METFQCEICRSKSGFHTVLKNVSFPDVDGTYQIVRCVNCGQTFEYPHDIKNNQDKNYPKNIYWGKNPDISNDRYNEIYTQILKLFPKPGSILDIGTGTGLFLTKFKQLGWTVVGTDIFPHLVKRALSKYGIKIIIGQIEKLSLPQKHYDVIVLNHVLEHLPHPKDTLIYSRKLLRDTGILVIAVPNIGGLGFKLFKDKWYSLQPGRHLWHFNISTLSNLITASGYQIHTIKKSDFPHDQYSFYQSVRFLFSSSSKNIPATSHSLPVSHPNIKKRLLSNIVLALSVIYAYVVKILDYGDSLIIVAKKRP